MILILMLIVAPSLNADCKEGWLANISDGLKYAAGAETADPGLTVTGTQKKKLIVLHIEGVLIQPVLIVPPRDLKMI
jgi:hypothetical protein